MHLPRRVAAAATSFALSLAAAVVPATHAAASVELAGQRSGSVAPAVAKTATVTLVTGDRVTVTTDAAGVESVSVSPAPGTVNPAYQSVRGPDGHRYVYPDSALAAVAAGTVDRAMFDVTGLIAQGYDDASTRELPVIVEYRDRPAGGALAARAQALPASHAAPAAAVIPQLGLAARRVDKADAVRFWRSVQPGLTTNRSTAAVPARLWLDGKVRALLDESVPLVGAPEAWRAGYTGSGATVAVLDSGVDRSHPDLAGQVVESASFVPDEEATDLNGHGTHVASTIAGTGAASGGRYTGVAPGAKLLSGKVLNRNGDGFDSWVLAGMAWAVEQGADVVSMSLGAYFSDGTDPMARAVNELSAASGALFVIAAGNAGPGQRTVTTPSTADAALSVAAFDKLDVLAPFSSRGPRFGDGAIKPEIAAPGVNITAARAAGTDIGQPVGDAYTMLSGTSMATPHVAGAAAILAQRHPDWTGQQIKNALMSTAVTSANATVYQQGAGRLDVARAVTQAVVGTGKADFGIVPAGDDQPKQVREVTYTNTGGADVTLTLDLRLAAGSRPMPAGAVTLSARTLTVPAGGSATATLTLDPAASDAGTYAGHLTATGDGVRVTTAVAYTRLAELHDLTIKVIGRHGDTPNGAFMSIVDLEDPARYHESANGYRTDEIRVRVPAGHYGVQGVINSADPGGGPAYYSSDVFAVEVTVPDRDATVTIDARAARDARFTVLGEPRPTEPVQVTYNLYRTAADGTRAGYSQLSELSTTQTRHGVIPSTRPRVGDLTMTTIFSLRDPLLQARVGGRKPSAVAGVSPRYTGRFDGTKRTQLVPVGAGTPGDYAGRDVAGKVALVFADEATGNDFTGLAATAAAAGAAGLIVAPDAPRVVSGWVSDGTAIPVIATSYQEGQRLRELVADGPVPLTLTGVRESRFTYTLWFQNDHVLPANPTYTVRRSDLAAIDNEYHADVPYHRGDDVTETYAPWEGSAFRFVTDLVQPGRRTDYVTAGRGVLTRQMVVVTPAPFVSMRMSGAPVAYRPGQHARDSWFRGPNHFGGYTELACNFCRSEDLILFQPAPLGDANPNHYGFGGWSAQVRAYRDGKQVANPNAVLVPEEATYRIEFDATQVDSDVVTHATRSRTAWTFRSKAPTKREIAGCADHDILPSAAECAALPVILLGYDLPLNSLNQAPGHGAFSFTVRTSRAKGLKSAAPVTGLRAWVTYDDGVTWQPASLVKPRHGGDYTVTVRHPKAAKTNGYVGLKVEAWDAAGNRTTQEILRAYALR
jgi:subtilisin family serine protease